MCHNYSNSLYSIDFSCSRVFFICYFCWLFANFMLFFASSRFIRNRLIHTLIVQFHKNISHSSNLFYFFFVRNYLLFSHEISNAQAAERFYMLFYIVNWFCLQFQFFASPREFIYKWIKLLFKRNPTTITMHKMHTVRITDKIYELLSFALTVKYVKWMSLRLAGKQHSEFTKSNQQIPHQFK